MNWTQPYFEHAYLKRWALEPPSATTHAEAAHLLALLSPPADTPLLDVGCGHGRYALALTSLGRRVVGLDSSRALLQRAAGHAVSASAPPQWVRADMRRLPFGPRFGGALLLDSFGFFDHEDDNTQVLRELRRILVPEGRVIVAVANPRPILANFRTSDVERRASVVVEIDRSLQRQPLQLIERVRIHETGNVTEYERRQRLYTQAESQAHLTGAAFAVRAVFADYTGGAFDEVSSSKVVTLAEAAA